MCVAWCCMHTRTRICTGACTHAWVVPCMAVQRTLHTVWKFESCTCAHFCSMHNMHMYMHMYMHILQFCQPLHWLTGVSNNEQRRRRSSNTHTPPTQRHQPSTPATHNNTHTLTKTPRHETRRDETRQEGVRVWCVVMHVCV